MVGWHFMSNVLQHQNDCNIRTGRPFCNFKLISLCYYYIMCKHLLLKQVSVDYTKVIEELRVLTTPTP